MENRNIIIVILVIIVILSVIAGVMFYQANVKKPTMLKITNDKSQYEGGKVSIMLADLNGTIISKEKVNITVTDSNDNVVVEKTIKTNSKGKAELDFDLKKGKYKVNATYEGNGNYTGNSTVENLTIKEMVQTQNLGSSYTTEPVYDGHTVSYQDGVRGVYSPSGEFFIDPTQDANYRTF